jgi:hypothetical protein
MKLGAVLPLVLTLGICAVSQARADEQRSVPVMPGALEDWSDAEVASMESILRDLVEQRGLPRPEDAYETYFMPAGTSPAAVWDYYAEKMGVEEFASDEWGDGIESAELAGSAGRGFVVVYAAISGKIGIIDYFAVAAPDAGAATSNGKSPAKAQAGWDVWCDFNNNIFPSFVLATATIRLPDAEDAEPGLLVLGDQSGRLGIHIYGAGGSTVTVTLKKNAIMDESTFSGTIPKGVDEALVVPKALFDYQALQGIRQPMPLNLVATVQLDGGAPVQKAITVTVRSINDCLFGRELGPDEDEDEDAQPENESFDWMFAAYVNENHPGVEKILKQALEAEIVEDFSGYAEDGDPEQVIRQVFAVWNVLQRQGVKYSSIDTTHSEDSSLWSQHVRFLDEVIDNTQANCVDGTVLFASVLRKIGIRPYLVLVPGHMFLAFSLDASEQELFGLETTMMGQGKLRTVDRKNEQLSAEIREKMKNETSWASFEEALNAGSEALKDAMSRLESEDDPEYRLISVAEARKLGILPIAFRRP